MSTQTFEETQNRALKAIADPLLPRFNRLVRTYVLLNAALFTAMFVELVLLLLFFTFLAKSALLAFGLALFFLTVFSYFMLRLYYQTAKPQQLQEIVDQFVANYKTLYAYREDQPEHARALANACVHLSDQLIGKETQYYPPPAPLVFATPYLEKLSSWCHWQDVHRMRELLVQASIEQHLHMVRQQPTNLVIHATLANAYLLLAELYLLPASSPLDSLDSYKQNLPAKFVSTSEKAIEEFKIMKEYNAKDPGPYLQLASIYHDLKRPLEEIAEYEALLQLDPANQEILYKLGCRYLAEGMNGKGLRIYESLRQSHYKKADLLIQKYGNRNSVA